MIMSCSLYIRYSVLRELSLISCLQVTLPSEKTRKNIQYFCGIDSKVNAVGADGDEGPPVPFPNTVVKLVCVDNTWWATAWEDRQVPTSNMTQQQLQLLSFHIPPQLSRQQHLTVNQGVTGSSPVGGANY